MESVSHGVIYRRAQWTPGRQEDDWNFWLTD